MWKPAHISQQHLRLFLLLSDEVACFAGPFLRRECLGLSYIYFYGMDNFSLPYIVCYRWREFGGITAVGSYSGFIRPLYSLFYVFERFHLIHERAQRAIHLRLFFTATFFTIFYSFHFMCSRDFILYMNAFMVYAFMVL